MESLRILARALGLLIATSLGPTASADAVRFRIAFEDVPGSAQLEAGEVRRGIEILEAAYEQGNVDKAAAMATLCGAYLLDGAMDRASSVCKLAAEYYPGKTSLNNFGIYLAITGEPEKAVSQFRKVQPLQAEEYLEFLRARDIGLIALQNEAAVRGYRHDNMSTKAETIDLPGKIEDLVK